MQRRAGAEQDPPAKNGVAAPEPLARRCAACHRLITFSVDEETRCRRCHTHRHDRTNHALFDTIV